LLLDGLREYTRVYTKFMQLRKPYLDSLPTWAKRWCLESYDNHPVTGNAYRYPNFRCTIKIHKTPTQTRPITGNHCWVTQPPAQLLAKLLLPYVCNLPVYVRDTDDIIRLLLDPIRGDFLLLTYDIVRLWRRKSWKHRELLFKKAAAQEVEAARLKVEEDTEASRIVAENFAAEEAEGAR
jgi:hypothetical protein